MCKLSARFRWIAVVIGPESHARVKAPFQKKKKTKRKKKRKRKTPEALFFSG